MKQKTGVLLVNLGTPDAPTKSAVYRYLKQFLLDGRVIDIPWFKRNLLVRLLILPFRTGNSTKLYKHLWTAEGSPLKFYGERLTTGVQEKLGDDYTVELAMRYQQPSIESAIEQLLRQQVHEIIVFPLFPHYASASTGSVHEEVMRIMSKRQAIPGLRFINSYHDLKPMIEVFAENGRKFGLENYDHVLFSYHGLPQRQLIKADTCNHCLKSADCCQAITEKNQFCYSAQCYATTAALVKELNLSEGKYTTCFQSRLGRDPWVQPYTSDVIDERAKLGNKSMLVFCPAFVADCLETTVEVIEEYGEQWHKLGGQRLDLVPSLNDHPKWVNTVAEYIQKESSAWQRPS